MINVPINVLESGKHLVDGPTDRHTDRPTDIKLPPPGCHVIQLTGTIFKLNSHIKETSVLIKFHENWANNVTSRVFTCLHYIFFYGTNAPPTGGHVFSPIWTIFKLKNALPTGGHVFSPISTIFELDRDIN
ncbi:hypothetical protein DPMN_105976 [Dreissena polymorpha]|uniref:Uncharacterized protein n=1 Tax=Dreissena polymorpha TaxID=45954 RepID=A0A9D4K457_DREPO|nr:hypothetical protein DPMN_105976 [Dreissena polymorpha]